MMKTFTRITVLLLSLSLLVACAQTGGGEDYRNEVGANGLPTPRALIARYVEAVGGEDLIRSHQSTTLNGQFNIDSFGIGGDMTNYAAAPNSVLQLIELSGLGTINAGYNGDVAWSVDPLQGATLMTGDALTDMVQNADYYLPLNYATIYPTQETLEVATVNGEDAYKVSMKDARGKETTIYINTESSLIVRTDAVASSPAGDVETTTLINSYGDFEGYLLPTSMSIDQAGQEISIEVDSYSFDDVSPDRFVPPAAIQSLL